MKISDPLIRCRRFCIKLPRTIYAAFISVFKNPRKDDLAQRLVFNVKKNRAFPTAAQWKFMPRVLSKSEKTALIASLVLLVASVCTAGIQYYITHRIDVPAVGGEYVEGTVGSPQLINPLYANVNDVDNDISRLVYSGLMKYNPKEGLLTDLAEKYEVSEDGKKYTFKLREDATWHDGERFGVRDVIFTFKSIQNSDYKSPMAVSFFGVEVEQVDDWTVSFTLEEPFAPFLSTMTLGILPSHIWGNIPPKNAQLTEQNLKPIGTGPYKFEKFIKEKDTGEIKSYTLVRNKNYYTQAPYIERVMFKFYANASDLAAALKNKNIEGAGYMPQEMVKEFEDSQTYNILRPSLPQYVGVFFNEEKQILLSNPKLREAMSRAVDRDQIVREALESHASPMYTPVFQSTVGENPDLELPTFDFEKAKALMDEAGWKLGEGAQVREKKIENETRQLKITLSVVDVPELMRTAELLKEQWADVGAQVDIAPIDPTLFYSNTVSPRNYEMLLTGELLGIDPDLYPFWHSSQIADPGLNLALYGNRKADKLLEDARTTTNNDTRIENYKAFQKIFLSDMPAIILYQPTYSYIVPQKIQNIEMQSIVFPDDRFASINSWYIKTKKKFR
ncbi:MAG: hypothetical protein ACD_76C00020G0004 [uncultured bacterium]|nr:MAG: hypothetical protein ACD_76C00020G0004 [uncultured bacterium]HBD05132.1 hypothetical protein [Candidatus Uhrbacteria bacterium]